MINYYKTYNYLNTYYLSGVVLYKTRNYLNITYILPIYSILRGNENDEHSDQHINYKIKYTLYKRLNHPINERTRKSGNNISKCEIKNTIIF